MNIAQALTGKTSPISHLPYHLVCPTCGRDHGYCGGYPITVVCFECETPIEYKRNPEYKPEA